MKSAIRYFPNVYLFVNGLIYLTLAYVFIADSNGWFMKLGIFPSQDVGFTELKTMYIGLMSAIGLFLIIASGLPAFQLPGLIFSFISYTMLGVVRWHGIFIAGFYNELMQDLLLAEIISALLAVIALYCLGKGRQSIQ